MEAKTKSESSSLSPDGSYQYQYVADNGNSISESGVGGVIAQGSAGWVSLEGVPLSLEYVADVNGFQPKGVHLPTPPPIPPQIARALEYIRTHPPKEEKNL